MCICVWVTTIQLNKQDALYRTVVFRKNWVKIISWHPSHAEGLAPPPMEILDPPLDVYRLIIGHNYRIGGGGGGGQV